jgi:hypothetical protein
MRKDTIAGLLIVGFGLTIGDAGLASAGVGIAIPVIPIGVYLIWRGYSIRKNQKKKVIILESKALSDSLDFERSTNGQIGLGIIILLIGIGTSSMIIGIPIAILGGYLAAYKSGAFIRIYKAIKKHKATTETRQEPNEKKETGE